jgi:hypothetical protein
MIMVRTPLLAMRPIIAANPGRVGTGSDPFTAPLGRYRPSAHPRAADCRPAVAWARKPVEKSPGARLWEKMTAEIDSGKPVQVGGKVIGTLAGGRQEVAVLS